MFSHPGRNAEYNVARDKSPSLAIALLWLIIMPGVMGYYCRCGGIYCILWWISTIVMGYYA